MIRKKRCQRRFIDPHYPIEFAIDYGFYCDIEEGHVYEEFQIGKYGHYYFNTPHEVKYHLREQQQHYHHNNSPPLKKQRTNMKYNMNMNIHYLKQGVYSVMVCYALCMSVYISLYLPLDIDFKMK